MRREQCRHRLAVGDVDLLEPEVRKRLELREPGLFQPRIVIGIEVVEADDVVPVRQQAPRDVHADEPGRSGDENQFSQDTSPFSGFASAQCLCAGAGRPVCAHSANDAVHAV